MIISEIRSRTIPDWNIILTLSALLLYFILYEQNRIIDGFIGGSLGFGTLYLIRKLKPLGFGDVKYAFILGVLTGWQRIFPAVAFAALYSLITFLPLVAAKKADSGIRIPFGPFLLAGGITVSFPPVDQLLNFSV